MSNSIRNLVSAAFAALALALASPAFSYSSTTNIPFSGTLSVATSSSSCSIISVSGFNSTFITNPTSVERNGIINVNCASGVPYSLSSTSWAAITVDGVAAGAALRHPTSHTKLSATPITGTGTGAIQGISVQVTIGGAAVDSNLNNLTGAISGLIPITLSW